MAFSFATVSTPNTRAAVRIGVFRSAAFADTCQLAGSPPAR